MPGTRRSRVAEWIALVAGTLAAAVWATWPLIRHLDHVLPGEDRDPLLNTWILAWTAERAHHLFRGLWDAPILYPYKHTFAFSEHLLGLAPVSVPLEWITANPLIAYNLLFLVSYVVAAAGMYLLVTELTGRRSAALVAAAAFAFCPYRVAQVARLQIEMCGWMAVMMWGLHRYIRTHRGRDLTIALAAFVVQGLTNGYYLYYALLPIAIVGISAWRSGRLDTRTALRGALVGSVVVLAVFGPLSYVYLDVRREYDLRRDLADNSRFSADVGSYLHVTPSIRARFVPARWLPDFNKPDGPLETKEGELFPGLVPVALGFAAIVLFGRTRTADPRHWYLAAWRRDIPVAAAVLACVALALGWNDAGISFLLWILLIRSVLPLPRTPAATYGVIALWAIVLSLGPEPTAWGRPFFPGSPYALLFHVVPGLDGLRVPARMGVITTFALAVVAGVVVSRIAAATLRRGFAVVAIALIFADVAVAIPEVEIGPRGRLPADALYQWLRREPPGAVLELPVGRMDYNYSGFRYEYATLTHGHPIVNGWTGYSTPLQQFLGSTASPLRDTVRFDAALDMLDGLGVRYIVVHPDDFEEPELVAGLLGQLRASGRASEAARVGDVVAFHLAGREHRSSDASVRPVIPSGATASDQADTVGRAFDGDLDTKWVSGRPQQGNEWVDLDLKSMSPVCGLELVVNPGNLRSLFSYPRWLRIETAEGHPVYEGSVMRQLGDAFRRDPAQPRVLVEWPAITTGRLRVRQTGQSATEVWAIDEVRVLTPAQR